MAVIENPKPQHYWGVVKSQKVAPYRPLEGRREGPGECRTEKHQECQIMRNRLRF